MLRRHRLVRLRKLHLSEQSAIFWDESSRNWLRALSRHLKHLLTAALALSWLQKPKRTSRRLVWTSSAPRAAVQTQEFVTAALTLPATWCPPGPFSQRQHHHSGRKPAARRRAQSRGGVLGHPDITLWGKTAKQETYFLGHVDT